MLPSIIHDHSPKLDYQKIQNSARHTVSVSPSEPMVQQDNEENLKESSFYISSIKGIKLIFILAGICFAAFLCMLPSILKTDERPVPEPLHSMVTYDMLTFFALIFAGFIWMFVVAYFEHRNWVRDINAGIDADTKTWILNDGRIAVSDEQSGVGRQCIKGILGYIHELGPVDSYPFNKLTIIDRVYSVSRENGIIRADAGATVFYLKFPLSDDDYTNTCIADNVEYFYNYYCARKRDKITWYENMYGRELLLQALDVLKMPK